MAEDSTQISEIHVHQYINSFYMYTEVPFLNISLYCTCTWYMNDQSLRLGKAKQLCLQTTPFFSREKDELHVHANPSPQPLPDHSSPFMSVYSSALKGRADRLMKHFLLTL